MIIGAAAAAAASSADDGADKKESKRPIESPFRQQKMRAWQPILTPKWAILTFLIFGVVFVPLGVFFYITSKQVVFVEQSYDHCTLYSMCNVTIRPTRTMLPPVYFYYQLDNYFQNHRRYVSSRSDAQLKGEIVTDVYSACYPMDTIPPGIQNNASVIRNPCGLIAASMFNDTFALYTPEENRVTWTSDGITWPSDSSKYGPLQGGILLAQNGYPALNTSNPDFLVWMRTAGLPRFKKLYRIINETLYENTDYRVQILNQYPVSQFAGKKSVYVTTTSWLGGANDFLGIAYMAVGSLCIVLGLAFLIKHAVAPRKLGDPQYINFEG